MEKIILEAMKKAGKPVRPGDISKILGIDSKEVSKAISTLKEKGLLIRLNHKALLRWILWVYPVTVIQSTVSRTGVL